MKISFWSNVREQVGVSTNMVCVSALTSIGGIGKTILLENHYNTRGIGEMVLEQNQLEQLHEHGEYFNRYGIEYILKRLYSGENGERLIHQASIPLLFSSMYYVPQSRIVNKEVFNYEFSLVQKELFRNLEAVSDYVYIDTEHNQNLSSNIILSESDLVVVNLDQNPLHLQDFFDNYSSIQEKAVYLIGRYQPEHPWSAQRICKEFHIPRNKIGMIPYNMELEDAMESGRILQFLNRNYFKPSDMESENLIRYTKKASKMIRKNALEIRKRYA